MILDIERAFFEQHRTEWLQEHSGKFAVVKNEDLIGFFDTAESAIQAGAARVGHEPFLIKQVLPQDHLEEAPVLFYGNANACS